MRLPFDFPSKGASYQAHIYKDGATKTYLVIEDKSVTNKDEIELVMLQNGDFAIRPKPAR